MAHFNPAVTIGFLITKHITKIQLAYYLCAEIVGALLGSLFVKYAIGFNANLGFPYTNHFLLLFLWRLFLRLCILKD
jgi:aquaporin Z